MIQVPLVNSDKFAIIDDEWKEDVLCQRWRLNNFGYAQTSGTSGFPEYHKIFLHTLIMGEKPGFQVDHVSGDRLDNRTANLRHVTRSQQMMNIAVRSDNEIGFKGVCRQGNRWRAYIMVNKHQKYVGLFQTFEEACAARKIAEKEFHGEYARR